MSENVELSSLDLRYEGHRLRDNAREARLLASIAERGIEGPLEGVDTAAARFLLNGFKRRRCAWKLGIACVPYVSLGTEEATGRRNAIYQLHKSGMQLRAICRQFRLSRNAVRAIIRQQGAAPQTVRKDKIQIDPELLRRLYHECDGWLQRVHERLVEEEGVQVSYPTLTRLTRQLGLGPTGCGKSGLATGFLLQALDRGYRGYFITFPDLIAGLYASLADRSEQQVLGKYARYDCLLIDELGYVEVEPAQVGLFFTLMQKRHKTKTTLVTSNLGFSEWGGLLKNNQLTGALLSRLTETSHVINMRNCHSLRPKLDEAGESDPA